MRSLKGHCYGNQLINLHPLDGSTFALHYYSLRGNTAMPGGLYAGLCHAFLVTLAAASIAEIYMHRSGVRRSVCLSVCSLVRSVLKVVR